MKTKLNKIIFVMVSGWLFNFGAHADFTYLCRGVDTQEACIKKFKAYDQACCVTQDSRPDPAVSKPSEHCKINFDNASCIKSGPGMLCTFKSSTCTPIASFVGYSYPLSYSCDVGAQHRVVFARNTDPKPEHTVGEEDDTFNTKPLFCTSKVAAVEPTTKKIDASPKHKKKDKSSKVTQ